MTKRTINDKTQDNQTFADILNVKFSPSPNEYKLFHAREITLLKIEQPYGYHQNVLVRKFHHSFVSISIPIIFVLCFFRLPYHFMWHK